jgi:hypothetical protein
MIQVNLLQPDFVISIGDYIEGDTTGQPNPDKTVIEAQWDEVLKYIDPQNPAPGEFPGLDMKFFFIPGNHDLPPNDPCNPALLNTKCGDPASPGSIGRSAWKTKINERYNKGEYTTYYWFRIKNAQHGDVLFLMLNAYNPYNFKPDDPNITIDKLDFAQREWAKAVLEFNSDVIWTFVCLHCGSFNGSTAQGWGNVEDLLRNGKCTILQGHAHVYKTMVKNNNKYIQLATTGGGKPGANPPHQLLAGMDNEASREFHHIMWVTMKKNGPIIANIALDNEGQPHFGVYPDTLNNAPPFFPNLAEKGISKIDTDPLVMPQTSISVTTTSKIKGFAVSSDSDASTSGQSVIFTAYAEPGKKTSVSFEDKTARKPSTKIGDIRSTRTDRRR